MANRNPNRYRALRLDEQLDDEIEAHRLRMEERMPGVPVTRSAAMRNAMLAGIAADQDAAAPDAVPEEYDDAGDDAALDEHDAGNEGDADEYDSGDADDDDTDTDTDEEE